MILDEESWMDIRRFKSLHESGATLAEIARECGVDWRTVKKYLAPDAGPVPPRAPSREGCQPRLVTPELEAVITAWLRADVSMRASVVHERLADQYGFTGHYQRVKMACARLRPAVEAELGVEDDLRVRGLHRRFATVPGAQAQVDWGYEGDLFGTGVKVYSFHMVLSFSRDPFCCFTTSMDATAFWDCHRRAFAHFGGVPGAIVYDRTKTVVKRHVRPGRAVPLQAEAVAFAEHYGFTIDVLAAYRPTGKGRVERQVTIVREHVLAGRSFTSLAQVDAAFMDWVPIRRRQVHRTTGSVIGVQAVDDAVALRALPATDYVVAATHLRRVGKDALISFDGCLYSVPAAKVRAGQRVEVRVQSTQTDDEILTIRALASDGGTVLAVHHRAQAKGTWTVDPTHWDGLPDGHTRATTTRDADLDADAEADVMDLQAARARRRRNQDSPSDLPVHVQQAMSVAVAARPLEHYAVTGPVHDPTTQTGQTSQAGQQTGAGVAR
jgi:transposase